MIAPDLVPILQPILALLDSLYIPYQIGGSLASITWSRPRTTHDADIVAALRPAHLTPLLTALDPDLYYVSDYALEDAIQRQAMFNILHLPTMFKIDVFVQGTTAFDTATFQRARQSYLDDPPTVPAWFTSPEDIVLLSWSGIKRAGACRIGNGWTFLKCCRCRRLRLIMPICVNGHRR